MNNDGKKSELSIKISYRVNTRPSQKNNIILYNKKLEIYFLDIFP